MKEPTIILTIIVTIISLTSFILKRIYKPDNTNTTNNSQKFVIEYYKSMNILSRKRWHWRVKNGNNKICVSKGFNTKSNAKRNLKLIRDILNISING
jgi:uncharacterized protein YegP (UPF0339 family)